MNKELLAVEDGAHNWSHEALKRFRIIFKAVQQHSQQVETVTGVSSAQLWIMWELFKKPGSKVTDIANALSIHHSTASNLLNKLARKGLINRERLGPDQRVVTVSLTPLGIEVFEKAPRPPRGVLQNALFELRDDEIRQLVENLDVLIDIMQVQDVDSALQPINPLPGVSRTKKKANR